MDWHRSTNTSDTVPPPLENRALEATKPWGVRDPWDSEEQSPPGLCNLCTNNGPRGKRRDLNPTYKRELNEPDVHQRKGMWNVSMCGEGGKGCRHKHIVGV